ncbi:unnamed protein product [Acanthosepion pharaonis]|uniref:Uncharacterized protein n=1 Tax=Acanthosepion pharaonis TaxID=158019 RepID=A0A812B307_ACAPH|nr:unnamed protein product [Sepia pharaonis]
MTMINYCLQISLSFCFVSFLLTPLFILSSATFAFIFFPSSTRLSVCVPSLFKMRTVLFLLAVSNIFVFFSSPFFDVSLHFFLVYFPSPFILNFLYLIISFFFFLYFFSFLTSFFSAILLYSLIYLFLLFYSVSLFSLFLVSFLLSFTSSSTPFFFSSIVFLLPIFLLIYLFFAFLYSRAFPSFLPSHFISPFFHLLFLFPFSRILLPPFFSCILFLLLSSFTSHIAFLRICFSFILIFSVYFPSYQGRFLFFLLFFVVLVRFCRILFICLPFILFSRLPSSLTLNYIYLLPSTRPLFILFPFCIVLDCIRFSLSISIPAPTSVLHHEISRFFLSSENQLRKKKRCIIIVPFFLV